MNSYLVVSKKLDKRWVIEADSVDKAVYKVILLEVDILKSLEKDGDVDLDLEVSLVEG